MPSCAYLRRQAALCLRIAAAVENPRVAAELVVMADDFSVKADDVDPSLDSTSLDSTSLGGASRRLTGEPAAEKLFGAMG
jgi:hypothetical protein